MNPNATPCSPEQVERWNEEQRPGQPDHPDGQLAELRQLDDYVIADGDPEIRGWEVKSAASLGERAVGRVEDLIVDLDTLRVRYMLVCLDKNAVATTRDRRILVPIGIGRLDEHKDEVRVDGYTSAHLVGIPEFRPGKLTRHYEESVRQRFAPPEPKAGPRNRRPGNFYEHSEFEERAFWRGRRRGREQVPYLIRRDPAGGARAETPCS
jgi:photosynthetic reaction center H subunit